MKKIFIWLFIMLAMTAGMTVYGEASPQQENALRQDSTVDVIGWFNKYDTVTYWVDNSSWKINGTDTVRTGSFLMKMRINVVDSTAEGYKMNCTFLEFPEDSLPESATSMVRFQNRVVAKLGQKIAGTTVCFETDECGRITEYKNLGKIKKQAKSLFKDAMKEFSLLPEIQELKKMGFNIMSYAEKVDTDRLVEGYLEELNLLFMFHGKSMRAGEFTEHEDATETQYENTTYWSAFVDDEDDSYQIVFDVTSILPQSELKKLVGGVVDSFSNDSITESFNKNFDTQVIDNGIYEDYLKTIYLYNGWPYYVVREKTTTIGDRGKINQTLIIIDSYHFAR